MIISASRRTDIPAFYSEWLINRLKDGFVYIRNPRYLNRIVSVALNTDVVDCIVFWTKNPQPMLNKLEIIDKMGYAYYFQFTITPYDRDVEPNLPVKYEIMQTFKELSNKIGKHRIIWRYDPVIISREFSEQYHIDAFGKMCDLLGGYTDTCILSFVDVYPKVQKRMGFTMDYEVNHLTINRLAQRFSQIAKYHKITIETCAEAVDLSVYGIFHTSCIDSKRIESIIGCPVHRKKDLIQRQVCGCIESIGIGFYDCCSYGCSYCYATTNEAAVRKNIRLHDRHSPMLIGCLREEDVLATKPARSLKVMQGSLF